MNRLLLALLTLSIQTAFAQVGIGNTAPKAQLDISASNAAAPSNFDGILIPRLNAFPITNPTNAQNGMLVFLTTSAGTNLPGFYYWSAPASAWVSIGANNKSWDVGGNSSAVSGTNFIGTTNAQDIDFRTNNTIKMRLTQKGQIEMLNTGHSVFIGEQAGANDNLANHQNVFVGYQSGHLNLTGGSNVAAGYQSLRNNTTGSLNSAFGSSALQANVGGMNNTAMGQAALSGNTSGNNNTAVGSFALFDNTISGSNTAVGALALRHSTTGTNNTALGANALLSNVSGYGNTGLGGSSLLNNDNGYFNTAIGFTAMRSNISGLANTATGSSALYNNTAGSNNTATGTSALLDNATGNNNTGTGAYALRANTNGSNNTAHGRNALVANVSGSNNTTAGFNSLLGNLTGNYNTASGATAMMINLTGSNNSAYGVSSLYFNTDGHNNTSAGVTSLLNNTTGNNNTAVGLSALSVNITGNNNTGVGNQANVTQAGISNATAIGNQAFVNASSKIRLGNGAVTVIEGQVAYSNPSDARFKNNVKANVPGLDFILKLKPVTYLFDTKKFDAHLMQQLPDSLKGSNQDYAKSSAVVHTGFLAQDIEKAAQSIGYDFDGVHIPDALNPTDNYSVAYSQFVIPMVKAIQEQQSEIELVKKENAELKSMAVQQAKMMQSFEARLSALEQRKP